MQPAYIMIIEDEEATASIYSAYINKRDDFIVKNIATNGEDALMMLSFEQPDLILLDLYLPDIHGLELLRTIRATYKNIDVMLITASDDSESVREAMRIGIFQYLLKPIMINQLYKALDAYKEQQSLFSQKTKLDQKKIDALFSGPVPASAAKTPSQETLPKGIDSLTLERIIEALSGEKTPQKATADDVASFIGSSHSTSRRYLEYLVSTGDVQVTIEHGKIGRPIRKYQFIS